MRLLSRCPRDWMCVGVPQCMCMCVCVGVISVIWQSLPALSWHWCTPFSTSVWVSEKYDYKYFELRPIQVEGPATWGEQGVARWPCNMACPLALQIFHFRFPSFFPCVFPSRTLCVNIFTNYFTLEWNESRTGSGNHLWHLSIYWFLKVQWFFGLANDFSTAHWGTLNEEVPLSLKWLNVKYQNL